MKILVGGKNIFFFSKSRAIFLLYASYLVRPFLVSSPPPFGLTAKSQQTSFLEETFGRDLFLHSWISENSLFLLPLTKQWSMLHLPLMWQNVVSRRKALARGTGPCEDALWGVILPWAQLCQPADSLRISPSVTNLWYVALLFQIFDNEAKDLEREVCFIDIACDEIPERYYKESEVSHRWDVVWKRFIHSFNKYFYVHPNLGDFHLSLCWFSLVSHLAGFLITSLKIKSLFLRAHH